MFNLIDGIKRWAANLKRDVLTLYLAARDPRVPRAAKLVSFMVAAYALSPIDLIPDFIPVLGYVDDLVIVPLGIALAVRLIPVDLLAELREEAARQIKVRPKSWWAAAAIVAIWIASGLLIAWLMRG